jgi:hypothetical protein
MKIEFKVPEWALGRHIYIFAGNELLGNKEVRVSHKLTNGKWEHITTYLPLKIKPADGRCTGCGTCCNTTSPNRKLIIAMKKALHGFRDYGKRCPFITDSGCMLGPRIPYSCVRSLCTDYEGCTERLEVIE